MVVAVNAVRTQNDEAGNQGMMPRSSQLRRAVLIVAAIVGTFASVSIAQEEERDNRPPQARPFVPPVVQNQNRFFLGPEEGRAEDSHGPSLFVVDRQTSRSLESAKELIAKKEFTQAVPLLQRVLDNSEDFGVADPNQKETFRSAKQEALNLIASLPATGLQAYEREYGAAAKLLLEEAATKGEGRTLAEVTRRYLHTEAGTDAAYRLISFYLDRSEPQTAALYIETLRGTKAAPKLEPMLSLKEAIAWYRIGDVRKAAQPLLAIRNKNPEQKIEIGGREVELFSTPDGALAWFETNFGKTAADQEVASDNWSMPRGGPSRNSSSGSIPYGNARWSAPILDGTVPLDPKQRVPFIDHLRKYEQREARDANLITLPVSQPIIVGDVVVYRSLRNVSAMRLSTGEPLWESATVDPHYNQIVQQPKGTVPISLGSAEPSALNVMMRERSWRDASWGSISSDGKNVFVLEDMGFWGLSDMGMRTAEPSPFGARTHNRLAAYDVATGKIQWQIGGPRGEHSLELAGCFFLGAPLPLGDDLFCLGEIDGEIRLIVVDPSSGKISWVQRLMFPEGRLANYPLRRVAGTAPSYAQGILVCPTTAGAVFGVDLNARKLLWVFRYAPEILEGAMSTPLKDFDDALLSNIDEQSRWLDSAAIIADGHVLLTPRDSDSLYCLNVLDGTMEWKRPRGEGLYLAGVHNGKAIVVGQSQVEAISLADKKDAWRRPTPIPRPNGRGIRNGNMYAIPLAGGEIATIELESGALFARSKVPGGSIGNLVSASDTIISQTADTLTAFPSLGAANNQITKKLESSPNDAVALASRGEIRLHLGQSEPGLADLRKALQLDPKSRAKVVLAGQLLEGLRNDFAAHRKDAAELEPLLESPAQRLGFHSVMAEGLATTGQPLEAWNEYLKLSEFKDEMREMVAVDNDATARGDRWITARVTELYEKSSDQEKAALDQASQTHLAKLTNAKDKAALKKFSVMFRVSPTSELARRALVDLLAGSSDALELELQLDHFRTSADSATSGWATAKLARLLIDQKLVKESSGYLDELEETWRDEKVLDDKTGHELVAAWKQEAAVAAGLKELANWPDRHLQSKVTEKATISTAVPRGINIRLLRGRSYRDWNFEIQRNPSGETTLTAEDAEGTTRWKYQFEPEVFDSESPQNGGYLQFGMTEGHLIVLLVRGRLIALDAIGDGKQPKLLWSKMLLDETIPEIGRRSPRMGAILSGPLTDDYVCYQIGATLFAADSLTGELLWERHNVPVRAGFIGDNEFVVTRPSNNDESLVLRATDASVVSNKPLPIAGNPLGWSSGRKLLTWTNLPLQSVLALTDVCTGRVAWQREFGARAPYINVGDDEVAVLDQGENDSAKLTILSLEDGHVRVDATIENIGKPAQISVYRYEDIYALFSFTPQQNQDNPRSYGPSSPLANKNAFGFDRRTGKQVWATPIPDSMLQPVLNQSMPIAVLKHGMKPRGGRSARNATANLSVLDLRNGRIFHEHTVKGRLEPVTFDMNRRDWKISINTLTTIVELSLADIPLSEPAPVPPLMKRAPVDAERPIEPLRPVPPVEPNAK